MKRGPDVAVGLLEHPEKPEHFLVQYRSLTNGQYPGWIEFPGGKVELNEEVEACLKRELNEEVGIQVLQSQKLCSIEYVFPSGLTHNVHFFLVLKYSGIPHNYEDQRIGWLTLYQMMTYHKMLPLNRAAALILTAQRHPDILD